MEHKQLINVVVGLLVVGLVAGFCIPLLNQPNVCSIPGAPSDNTTVCTQLQGPFHSNSALDNATGNTGMLTAIASIFGMFVLIALLLMAVKVLGNKSR